MARKQKLATALSPAEKELNYYNNVAKEVVKYLEGKASSFSGSFHAYGLKKGSLKLTKKEEEKLVNNLTLILLVTGTGPYGFKTLANLSGLSKKDLLNTNNLFERLANDNGSLIGDPRVKSHSGYHMYFQGLLDYLNGDPSGMVNALYILGSARDDRKHIKEDDLGKYLSAKSSVSAGGAVKRNRPSTPSTPAQQAQPSQQTKRNKKPAGQAQKKKPSNTKPSQQQPQQQTQQSSSSQSQQQLPPPATGNKPSISAVNNPTPQTQQKPPQQTQQQQNPQSQQNNKKKPQQQKPNQLKPTTKKQEKKPQAQDDTTPPIKVEKPEDLDEIANHEMALNETLKTINGLQKEDIKNWSDVYKFYAGIYRYIVGIKKDAYNQGDLTITKQYLNSLTNYINELRAKLDFAPKLTETLKVLEQFSLAVDQLDKAYGVWYSLMKAQANGKISPELLAKSYEQLQTSLLNVYSYADRLATTFSESFISAMKDEIKRTKDKLKNGNLNTRERANNKAAIAVAEHLIETIGKYKLPSNKSTIAKYLFKRVLLSFFPPQSIDAFMKTLPENVSSKTNLKVYMLFNDPHSKKLSGFAALMKYIAEDRDRYLKLKKKANLSQKDKALLKEYEAKEKELQDYIQEYNSFSGWLYSKVIEYMDNSGEIDDNIPIARAYKYFLSMPPEAQYEFIKQIKLLTNAESVDEDMLNSYFGDPREANYLMTMLTSIARLPPIYQAYAIRKLFLPIYRHYHSSNSDTSSLVRQAFGYIRANLKTILAGNAPAMGFRYIDEIPDRLNNDFYNLSDMVRETTKKITKGGKTYRIIVRPDIDNPNYYNISIPQLHITLRLFKSVYDRVFLPNVRDVRNMAAPSFQSIERKMGEPIFDAYVSRSQLALAIGKLYVNPNVYALRLLPTPPSFGKAGVAVGINIGYKEHHSDDKKGEYSADIGGTIEYKSPTTAWGVRARGSDKKDFEGRAHFKHIGPGTYAIDTNITIKDDGGALTSEGAFNYIAPPGAQAAIYFTVDKDSKGNSVYYAHLMANKDGYFGEVYTIRLSKEEAKKYYKFIKESTSAGGAGFEVYKEGNIDLALNGSFIIIGKNKWVEMGGGAGAGSKRWAAYMAYWKNRLEGRESYALSGGLFDPNPDNAAIYVGRLTLDTKSKNTILRAKMIQSEKYRLDTILALNYKVGLHKGALGGGFSAAANTGAYLTALGFVHLLGSVSAYDVVKEYDPSHRFPSPVGEEGTSPLDDVVSAEINSVGAGAFLNKESKPFMDVEALGYMYNSRRFMNSDDDTLLQYYGHVGFLELAPSENVGIILAGTSERSGGSAAANATKTTGGMLYMTIGQDVTGKHRILSIYERVNGKHNAVVMGYKKNHIWKDTDLEMATYSIFDKLKAQGYDIVGGAIQLKTKMLNGELVLGFSTLVKDKAGHVWNVWIGYKPTTTDPNKVKPIVFVSYASSNVGSPSVTDGIHIGSDIHKQISSLMALSPGERAWNVQFAVGASWPVTVETNKDTGIIVYKNTALVISGVHAEAAGGEVGQRLDISFTWKYYEISDTGRFKTSEEYSITLKTGAYHVRNPSQKEILDGILLGVAGTYVSNDLFDVLSAKGEVGVRWDYTRRLIIDPNGTKMSKDSAIRILISATLSREWWTW